MKSLQQTPSGNRKDRLLELLGGLKGHLLSLMIGVVLYLGYLADSRQPPVHQYDSVQYHHPL